MKAIGELIHSKGLLLLTAVVVLAFIGCSDDDGGVGGFKMTIDDVQGYQDWERVDYTIYPTFESKLGEAHTGNNPNNARMTYDNDAAVMQGDKYRQGAIYYKETFSRDTTTGDKVFGAGGHLAMAKRGAGYAPDGGDWEYFNLGDGSEIVGRGNDLGACNSCHTAATGNFGMDFVFAHPAEYEMPASDEWDIFSKAIADWVLIDSNVGPDPLLGQAHGINDTLTRDVYRWQPGAYYDNGEFPVGTVFMKEVYRLDANNEKEYVNGGAGAWTGMVKRGGNFNPDNGNWEWFMINPETEDIVRGAEVMDNACNSCHSAAPNNNGGDYVFYHPGIGFTAP